MALDYKLMDYTGNGYKVIIYPDFLVDGFIPVHPAIFYLDINISSKVRARELLKSAELCVETIISHEPVFLPEIEEDMRCNNKSWEDVYLSQRMLSPDPDDDLWYIDDFGFYVYCYSFIAKKNLLKDLRYD